MLTYNICQKIFVKVYLLLYIFLRRLSPVRVRAHSMEIGKFVGERVRQRRKALGMTQEQLEAASGVPQGSISRIESGTAEDVYASTVLGFAKALRVSADFLLGLDAEQQPDREQATSKGSGSKGQRQAKRPAKAKA